MTVTPQTIFITVKEKNYKLSQTFFKMIKRCGKKAQVWVETVIYTLIAITIIGLFLSFAKPKIQEIQDKSIIEQSVEMLQDINSIVLNIVQGGPGNKRVINLGIKKGTLFIDSENDVLLFEMDGRYTYTEPGVEGAQGPYINIGNIIASTKKIGDISTVTLISNYSGIYNITYQGEEKMKGVSKSAAPHSVSITNKYTTGNIPQIDISLT